MGTIQLKNSDYNKDQNFHKIAIDETVKITLSEAIAKQVDDNKIEIFGFAEFPLVGVTKIQDLMWVFEPSLVRFTVPLKDYETEYQGKKKQYKQSPGMRAAIHLIEGIGYDKPFSAMFDFSMANTVAECIITGKQPDGTQVKPEKLEVIRENFADIKPLDKLTKMEGIELAVSPGKRDYGKGGGMQKEGDRLKDRLAFLTAQLEDNSELEQLLTRVSKLSDDSSRKVIITMLVENLFR